MLHLAACTAYPVANVVSMLYLKRLGNYPQHACGCHVICSICFGHICKHMLPCGHASSHIRSGIIMSHAIFTQSCKFSTWATIQQEHAPPGHGACILSGHKHTLFQGLAQELAEFGNISLTEKSVKHVTFHPWGNCQSL